MSIFSSTHHEPEKHPDELIHKYMTMLDYDPSVILHAAVIDPLIASGKITLIRNEALSYKLNTWPRLMDVINGRSDYLRESVLLNTEFLSEFHQYKDVLWVIDEKKGHPGASHFMYDQSRLLANPKIETIVGRKRVDAEATIVRMERLAQLQQEILTLIDAELTSSP